jgi:predicted transcriptional regulator
VGLVGAACASRDVADELAEVARRRPDLLRPFHRRLVDADVWWPVDLYRGMDEATAGYVVQLIEAGAERPDKLLELLAVGATDAAVQAMRRWDRQPPV